MTTTNPTTFLQYAKTLRDAKRAEYGISVKEAEEFYPDNVLRPEWVQHLIRLASEGVQIPASVARTLSEEESYAVNKFGYSFSQYV